jgi:hypothetical protein
MALLKLFLPLQRVPAAILNALQKAALDQRGNGVGNTLATGLDAEFTAWDCGRVQIAIAQPATPISLEIDATKDWRDRQLTVSWRFDPTRDIRPGEAFDKAYAKDRGLTAIYTNLGNQRWLLGPSMTLFVGPTGHLFIEKTIGFAYIEITTSTQLKERS